MHLIDTAGHVANNFSDGDPGVPTPGTVVDDNWLNMVGRELYNIVTDGDSGVTPIKDTNTQVREALRVLFVRAKGAATQTIDGLKTFSALASFIVASGRAIVVETTENTLEAMSVGNFGAGGGLSAFGLAFGLKGIGTAGGANPGVWGLNSSGTGGYGVVAEGKQISAARAAFRIVPQDNEPTTPLKGDLYVNTSTGKLMIYDGATFVVVGSQS